MVITGYWVGPDIDDGWGFVEASIDQSSWFFPQNYTIDFCMLLLLVGKCQKH